MLLCFCGLLLLSGCVSGTAAEPKTFRVMSYNIHHGGGLDGKVDLDRIAALIKREGADIVGLQEVDKGVERTQRRDLGAELAKLTGMTCIFSNNLNHQGGEYGNAVLTKFPVGSWTNHHYKMLREGEQRGILQLTLKVHGKDLVFMNTHLDHRSDGAERMLSTGEIREMLARVKGKPVVLCGDFNCTPDSPPYAKLAEVLTDAWTVAGEGDGFTIPARKATKRIDFIWLSKEPQIVPKRVWVPVSEASDHLPVVAELELR
jgi:endonuclease/exonuclease/phosphatase family metal-dependent hydrolase